MEKMFESGAKVVFGHYSADRGFDLRCSGEDFDQGGRSYVGRWYNLI